MNAKQYLIELQKRLLTVIITFVLTFILGVAFSKQMFTYFLSLINPLGIKIVSLNPYENISIFLSFAFLLAIIITIPVALYNFLKFIMPALSPLEKKVSTILPFIALFLFILGFLFNFYITIEFIIPFLYSLTVGVGIENTWSIGYFINFILYTSFIMGLIFQFPLVLLVLIKYKILEISQITQFRKHIYISLLILSAFITPPDFFSMFIVALPLMFIFEITIIIGRLIRKK